MLMWASESKKKKTLKEIETMVFQLKQGKLSPFSFFFEQAGGIVPSPHSDDTAAKPDVR